MILTGGRDVRCGIAALAVLASLSVSGSVVAEEVTDWDRFSLANNCGPMYMDVRVTEAVSETIKEKIEIAVRSRLRAARIYDESADALLELTIVQSDREYGLMMLFYKRVWDDVSNMEGVASAWSYVQIGSRSYLVTSVGELMDRFLDEYLWVNDAACKAN